MKKLFQLFFMLCLCLSLCACTQVEDEDSDKEQSKNSKYTGTYTCTNWVCIYPWPNDDIRAETMLTLNADGTGSCVTTTTQSIGEVDAGFVAEDFDIEWEVDENEYITLYYDGTVYWSYDGVNYSGESEAYSRVYTLKGNELIPNSHGDKYTKVK